MDLRFCSRLATRKGAPWSVVEDVTFRKTSSVTSRPASISSHGDIKEAADAAHRDSQHVLSDVGGTWAQRPVVSAARRHRKRVITNHGERTTGGVVFGGDHDPHAAFVFQNNVMPDNAPASSDRERASAEAQSIGTFQARHKGNVLPVASRTLPLDNHFSLGDRNARRAGADVRALTEAMDEVNIVAQLNTPRWCSGAPLRCLDTCIRLSVMRGCGGACVRALSLERRSSSVTVVVVRTTKRPHRPPHREPLASDYPRERLRLSWVAMDRGPHGRYRPAVRGSRLTVPHFGQRRGKPAVLNDLIAWRTVKSCPCRRASALRACAIRALVANFADAEVGAVSGSFISESAPAHRPAEKARGSTGSTRSSSAQRKLVGSTSARPARFSDPPQSLRAITPDTILDDVLIPMQIVRKGYRVLFEADARAHDLIAMNPREDFIRKARTIAGTFQLFARHPWMLNPLRCRVWFEAFSHKALRLAIPVLHLAVLAANVALIDVTFYRVLLAGQAAFYAAGVGYFQADRNAAGVRASSGVESRG